MVSIISLAIYYFGGLNAVLSQSAVGFVLLMADISNLTVLWRILGYLFG